MGVSFAASTPQVPDIELGMYDALLQSVEPIYMKGGQYGEGFVTEDENGNKVNRFRWTFALLDDDGNTIYDEGDPIEVDTITGLQFFAKAQNPSKQVKIMKALMTPAEFESWAEGEAAPGLTDLLQRKVQVEVGENDKGYPTCANVLAPRQRRARKATASPAESDAE
jgi:hypothetical protein